MKILIADDHPVVREGLIQILKRLPEVAEIEEVTTGTEALKNIKGNHYDCVILDISLPGMSGLEVLKNLRIQNTVTPVLVLSMHPEEQFSVRALKLGASGYVTKDRAAEELIIAINKISSGKKYVSSELAEYMASSIDYKYKELVQEKLTDREFQVMIHLARGKSPKEISSELNISTKTVSTHRANILEKMAMKNNSELVIFAMKNFLIE